MVFLFLAHSCENFTVQCASTVGWENAPVARKKRKSFSVVLSDCPGAMCCMRLRAIFQGWSRTASELLSQSNITQKLARITGLRTGWLQLAAGAVYLQLLPGGLLAARTAAHPLLLLTPSWTFTALGFSLHI